MAHEARGGVVRLCPDGVHRGVLEAARRGAPVSVRAELAQLIGDDEAHEEVVDAAPPGGETEAIG